jgi:putative glutamine amidotransferase
MKTPIIGIPLDSQESGGYSTFPWCALRENYLSSITQCGGLPIALSHEQSFAHNYLDMIDGLLITGAGFDIDPALYGETIKHPTVRTNPKRTNFEWLMIKGALERNMPILGICGGLQLINIVLGGTLIQHIPDIPTSIEHFNSTLTANLPCHFIDIEKDTLLFKAVNIAQMNVNSRHHQAVKTIGAHVIINARSQDGLIEGVEYTKHPFCMGVQWHPEFFIDPQDQAVIRAFIKAST